MAQAILDLHANAEDAAALEEGKISTTTWSGIGVDNIHVKQTTYAKMERQMQQSMLHGFCSAPVCDYHTGRQLHMIQYMESHFILYICMCGYFSSYRDTTTKRHHDENPAVMQVDYDH